MVGYTRAEVMQKSCSCSFMFGDQTDKDTVDRITMALEMYTIEQIEIRLYKKNSKEGNWSMDRWQTKAIFSIWRNPTMAADAYSAYQKWQGSGGAIPLPVQGYYGAQATARWR